MTVEDYDVVIVGCGPAGARTAAGTAARGLSTLILEKRERIGYPVRCAEAIGPAGVVERLVKVDENWISCRVGGVSIVSPDGHAYERDLEGAGFVVDRTAFDRSLADGAVEAGAVLRTGHQASGLALENGMVVGVDAVDLSSNREYRVSSRVVVGADGVESLSTRWAGIRKAVRPDEMFSCAQFLVTGIDVPRRHIEFHLGREIAPGGYGWVFPKGADRANVGVGIDPARADGTTAVECLERFIARRCPGATRERFVAGGTLTGCIMPSAAAGGYLAAGEAAGLNNPFTGGGILEAVIGADIAAEVIADAFESRDFSRKSLGRFDRIWKSSGGRSARWLRRAALVFYSLSDESLCRMLRELSAEDRLITESGISAWRFLKVLMRSCPSAVASTALKALAGR